MDPKVICNSYPFLTRAVPIEMVGYQYLPYFKVLFNIIVIALAMLHI